MSRPSPAVTRQEAEEAKEVKDNTTVIAARAGEHSGYAISSPATIRGAPVTAWGLRSARTESPGLPPQECATHPKARVQDARATKPGPKRSAWKPLGFARDKPAVPSGVAREFVDGTALEFGTEHRRVGGLAATQLQSTTDVKVKLSTKLLGVEAKEETFVAGRSVGGV